MADNIFFKTAIKSPIDINRASGEEWQQLPGIGEKRAEQITKFRGIVGRICFRGASREMYGLPDSVFQRIKPMLTPNVAAVRKIDINTASAEVLDAHPYISLKQANLIISYREQHGRYAAVDDLAGHRSVQRPQMAGKSETLLDGEVSQVNLSENSVGNSG